MLTTPSKNTLFPYTYLLKLKQLGNSLVCATCFFSMQAMAAPLTPQVKTEIEHVLTVLSKSGCSFNRNGTWYTAQQAQEHLLSKLAYLERKDMVSTTEQFIDLAGSTSSVSGKAYTVKCDNTQVDSKAWLTQTLTTLRKTPKK